MKALSHASFSHIDIDSFKALRQEHEHGEFRVKDGELIVAGDSFAGRNLKSLVGVSKDVTAQRSQAMSAFKDSLVQHCGSEEEAAALLKTAINPKHPDRLNVKDLDRIALKLQSPDESEPELPKGGERGDTGPTGKMHGASRAELLESGVTGEAQEARAEVADRMRKVADDPRLTDLVKAHHPGLSERIVDRGLTSGKFYASLVPVLGAGIAIKDASESNGVVKVIKSVREDHAGPTTPLLNACLDGLEDHHRAKRGKRVASAVVDIVTTPIVVATGGLGVLAKAPVTKLAGSLTGTAIGMATNSTAGQVVKQTATKGTGAVESGRVKDLASESGQMVGSGDGTGKLDDYRTVRALLAYLGPSTQIEEIRADKSLKPEERQALLKQEKARLDLKGMMGSPDTEHLSSATRRTPADKAFLKTAKDRETHKAEDGGRFDKTSAYTKLRGGDEEAAEVSPLRALWLAEGWLSTGSTAEKVSDTVKLGAKEMTSGVSLKIDDGSKYGKLEESP